MDKCEGSSLRNIREMHAMAVVLDHLGRVLSKEEGFGVGDAHGAMGNGTAEEMGATWEMEQDRRMKGGKGNWNSYGGGWRL